MVSLCHRPSRSFTHRESKEVDVWVSMVDEVDDGDCRFAGALRLVSRCPMMRVDRPTHCPSWSL